MRLFLAWVLLLLTLPVQAAELDKQVSLDHIPKLNREVILSAEAFTALTKPIEEIPLNNKFLAYKIRLPKNWTPLPGKNSAGQTDLSKRILGNIVEYLGPPTLDLRSSFRIRANDIIYDIAAKDWFLNYIFSSGFNLEGMDISSEKRVQAQYVMVDNGNQYRVRAVAQISGPRIILAEYIVPIDFWETEKDIAKRSMAGFVLTHPDPAPIEIMQTYSFVDIAQFNYPVSWILRAPPVTSIERMSASLTNIRGNSGREEASRDDKNVVIDGRIDISIVTKNPDIKIENELKLLKTQMLEKGLVLGDLIERADGWSYHKGITFSRIEAYKVNNVQSKLANYEQWVGIFETPTRYYFVRLLTIGRQDDFLIWSRNVKAYRTVIGTLSPVIN